MMSCEQINRLGPLFDGELSPAEVERLTAHVASCSACSAEMDELRAMRRLMTAARAQGMGMPSDDAMNRLRFHVQGLVEQADVGLIWIARVFSGVAASVLIAGLWLLNQPAQPAQPQAAGAWERAAYMQTVDPMPVATAPDLRSPESILDDLAGENLSSAQLTSDWMEAELP